MQSAYLERLPIDAPEAILQLLDEVEAHLTEVKDLLLKGEASEAWFKLPRSKRANLHFLSVS